MRGGGNHTHLHSGRVEVRFASGNWGTICDDGFNDTEASVICNMLGYPYGVSVAEAFINFGSGRGAIYMDDVNCVGNETSILACQHRGWARHNCNHREDAGVICYPDRGNSLYKT